MKFSNTTTYFYLNKFKLNKENICNGAVMMFVLNMV